jgi:hypothetical protein
MKFFKTNSGLGYLCEAFFYKSDEGLICIGGYNDYSEMYPLASIHNDLEPSELESVSKEDATEASNVSPELFHLITLVPNKKDCNLFALFSAIKSYPLTDKNELDENLEKSLLLAKNDFNFPREVLNPINNELDKLVLSIQNKIKFLISLDTKYNITIDKTLCLHIKDYNLHNVLPSKGFYTGISDLQLFSDYGAVDDIDNCNHLRQIVEILTSIENEILNK